MSSISATNPMTPVSPLLSKSSRPSSSSQRSSAPLAIFLSLLCSVLFCSAAQAQAPSGVSATAQNTRTVEVWGAVTGATTYNLYRATTSGGEGSTPYAGGLTHPYYVDQPLANGTTYYYEVTAVVGGVESAKSAEVSATPLLSITTVQLDCGNTGLPYTDTFGNMWSPDYRYASSGTVLTTGTTVNGTPDSTLYQTARQGTTITYTLSLNNGNYDVRLLFAEISSSVTAKGQRVFSVMASSGSYNATLLNNFDVFYSAGNMQYVAIQRDFTVPVTGNQLVLTFTGSTGKALINGIQTALIPSGGGILQGVHDNAAPDIEPPDWAQDDIGTDESSSSDGIGPSMGAPVDLASGTEVNDAGPDMEVYNFEGPTASFERIYTTTNANSGYGSKTLSPGWSDNYDNLVNSTSGSWGPITFTQPNGESESWTPNLVGGSPPNPCSFITPTESPYIVSGVPTVHKGQWQSITIQYKDRSVWTFTPDSNDSVRLRLTQIKNVVGHYVSINRDPTSHFLTSIANDLGTALLTFNYTGGVLSSITDMNGREVNYSFTSGGNLQTVSQMYFSGSTPPTVPRWQYSYVSYQSRWYLDEMQSPDPSNPTVQAASIITYYAGNAGANMPVVASHTDANLNVHALNHDGVIPNASVSVASANGVLDSTYAQLSGTANQNTGFIDAAGNTTTVAYNSAASGSNSLYTPSSYTNRNNETVSVTYTADNFDNPASETDNRGDVTTYSYTYPSGFPLGELTEVEVTHETSGTTDATLQPTQYTYYPTTSPFNGMIDTIVSPEPGTTVANPATVTTTITYDATTADEVNGIPLGNVLNAQSPAPMTSGTETTTLAYSSSSPSLGEPRTVTDPSGDTTTFTYDSRGNCTSVEDANGFTTDYFYTVDDRLQAVVYPSDSGSGNAVLYYSYEFTGGPVLYISLYSEGQVTAPALGQPFPDPLGTVTAFRQTAYTYGHEGETLAVNDLAGLVSGYSYDGDYRVTAEEDGLGHTSLFFYDQLGDLLQEQYPGETAHSAGAMEPAGTTDTASYGYDPDQNLIMRVDGNDVTTTYLRDDPESLVTGISYSTGYTGVGFGYDVFGRRQQMTDVTGSTYYGNPNNSSIPGYDDLGDLMLSTRSFAGGPQGQTLNYGYFLDGSLSTITLPGSGEVHNPQPANSGNLNYLYFPDDLLETVIAPWTRSGTTGPAEAINYTYFLNHWIKTASDEQFTTTYAFFPRGFISGLQNSGGPGASTEVSDYSFTASDYDAAGDTLGESVQIPSQTFYAGGTDEGSWPDLNRNLAWGYDNRGRLTQEASYPTSGGLNNSVTSYGFYYKADGADNLIAFETPTPQAQNYSANSDNQYSNSGFTYDGAGSATTYSDDLGLFNATGFQYDPEHELIGIPAANFSAAYDGDGQRAYKTTSSATTYFLYDLNGEPIADETMSGSTAYLADINIYGADGLRERNEGIQNGTEYYDFTYDPQGTLQARNNEGQFSVGNDISTEAVYSAYGTKRADFNYSEDGTGSQTTHIDPVGFDGQDGYFTDSDAGSYFNGVDESLISLGRRYYDPGAGRFFNRDPIDYAGGENLYGYAGDNPVNEVDPSGTSGEGEDDEDDAYIVGPPDGNHDLEGNEELDFKAPEEAQKERERDEFFARFNRPIVRTVNGRAPELMWSRPGPNGELVVSYFGFISPSDIDSGTKTDAASRDYARLLGRATDDAGHIRGSRLGGGPSAFNIFPQDPGINRGAYRHFEEGIAKDVLAGNTVFIKVDRVYSDNNQARPYQIIYTKFVNGVATVKSFPNP